MANPDGSSAARIMVSAAPSVTMLISISPTAQLVSATDGDVDALRDPVTPVPSTDAMTVAGSIASGSAAEFFPTIGTVLPAWTTGDTYYASQADTSALNGGRLDDL